MKFDLEATALRDIELRDAQDTEIFEAARTVNAVMKKIDLEVVLH